MIEIFGLLGLSVARVAWLDDADRPLQQSGGDRTVEFARLPDAGIFFVEDGQAWFARSLPALLGFRRGRGLANALSAELLRAYDDAGLVLPPFTAIEGVYQAPAFSRLLPTGDGWRLEYHGLTASKARPFAGNADVFDELAAALRRQLAGTGPNARIVCTVSGGSDSAALLHVLAGVAEPERILGLTCRMPGLEGEVEHAREICARAGVDIHVFDPAGVQADPIIDEFTQAHANLVLDPVVPVIASMFREVRAILPEDAEVVFVEGQGADTVLAGLPHNAAIALHTRAAAPLFGLASAVLPHPDEKLRAGSRNAYRAVKMARLLSEPDWRRALLRSLDFERDHHPGYYRAMERMLQAMEAAGGGPHKAIMLFFLGILQVRELQKYQMLPERSQVILPFLDPEFMQRCFATPTRQFFARGRRKIPVNDAVKDWYPGMFSSERTTPFAVEYPVGDAGGGERRQGTYARLKARSTAALATHLRNDCE